MSAVSEAMGAAVDAHHAMLSSVHGEADGLDTAAAALVSIAASLHALVVLRYESS